MRVFVRRFRATDIRQNAWISTSWPITLPAKRPTSDVCSGGCHKWETNQVADCYGPIPSQWNLLYLITVRRWKWVVSTVSRTLAFPLCGGKVRELSTQSDLPMVVAVPFVTWNRRLAGQRMCREDDTACTGARAGRNGGHVTRGPRSATTKRQTSEGCAWGRGGRLVSRNVTTKIENTAKVRK